MVLMGSLRRASIGAIAFNVALIHAAGLVLLNQHRPDPAKGGAGPSRPSVLQMRLAKAMPAPALTTHAAFPTLSKLAVDEGKPPLTDTVPTAAETPAVDVPSDAQQFEPLVVDNVLSDVDLSAGAGDQASGSEYVPRPQLSTAPRPSTPVVVPFPAEVTSPGRYAAILALFIDETGVVRRVRVDGPSLPKPMEDAARDSFLQAHFSPGEVDGRQVKSLIRVEVVFDNTPIEAMAQPQS